jgi:ribonuclease HI
MGVGLVARDSTGKVRASMCNFLPYLTDPAVAEAYAARQGAELLRDMGFQKILLEGDAQVIVQAINYAGVCSARYANIIDDTRTILQSFSSWRALFVRRECNSVAHSLARMAVTQCLFQVWIESVPDLVQNRLMNSMFFFKKKKKKK